MIVLDPANGQLGQGKLGKKYPDCRENEFGGHRGGITIRGTWNQRRKLIGGSGRSASFSAFSGRVVPVSQHTLSCQKSNSKVKMEGLIRSVHCDRRMCESCDLAAASNHCL